MNRSPVVHFTLQLIQIFSILIVTPKAHAIEVFAEIGETTTFNSNVYLDDSQEWDIVIAPQGSLDLEFKDIYAIGYAGQVSIFPRHDDLLYHTHDVYFLLNPMWGEYEEYEFILELSLGTHRNRDSYSDVNLVEPMLFTGIDMSPADWFRVALFETLSYRWFYDDTASDALTNWARGELTFTAPTRTAFTPRIAYGLRHYPNALISNRQDHQLHAGLRLSQNIIEGLGLRIDYTYIHAFNDSVLVRRNIDAVTFHYIGEDFLFSGHQALSGLKLIMDNGFSADASIEFVYKRYLGWPVRDEVGVATLETREDRVLSPACRLSYLLSPSDDAFSATPAFEVSLQYAFIRNWSNDTWYDTNRHVGSLELTLNW